MFYSTFFEERGFVKERGFLTFLPHFLLQRDVKQSELIGKPCLNPNHCSISMGKVFFLQIFAQKQTFDRILSLLETLLSPFESWFSRTSASTNHGPSS